MKMVPWCLYIIAILLVHTTTVVDCDYPDVDNLDFNTSQGALYMEDFFTPAHLLIAQDQESFNDGFHVNLPFTPKDIYAPPKAWIKVNLYSGGSLTPKGATFMRKDSMYTLAYLDVDGVLHYIPAYAHFFKDFRSTMPLPFTESYAGLTGTPEGDAVYPALAKVAIGRSSAEVAVDILSTYRGMTATTNVESVREAFLRITIMTSEALRIQGVRKACEAAWGTIGTITEEDALNLLAWGAHSLLYRTNDLNQLTDCQRRKLRRVKVTTGEQAGNIIDLVYRPQN